MAEKGVTNRQLAEQCGISEQAVGQYLRGKSRPSRDTLAKIADSLDKSMDDLMESDAESQPNPIAAAWATDDMSETAVDVIRVLSQALERQQAIMAQDKLNEQLRLETDQAAYRVLERLANQLAAPHRTPGRPDEGPAEGER